MKDSYIRFPRNTITHKIWEDQFKAVFENEADIAPRSFLCKKFYDSNDFINSRNFSNGKRGALNRPVPRFGHQSGNVPTSIHPDVLRRDQRKRRRESDSVDAMKRQKAAFSQLRLQNLKFDLEDRHREVRQLLGDVVRIQSEIDELSKELNIPISIATPFSMLDTPVTPSPISLSEIGRFYHWFGVSDVKTLKDLVEEFIVYLSKESVSYNLQIPVGDCVLFCLLRLRRGYSYVNMQSMSGRERRRISEAVHRILPHLSNFLKDKCAAPVIADHFPPICKYVNLSA